MVDFNIETIIRTMVRRCNDALSNKEIGSPLILTSDEVYSLVVRSEAEFIVRLRCSPTITGVPYTHDTSLDVVRRHDEFIFDILGIRLPGMPVSNKNSLRSAHIALLYALQQPEDGGPGEKAMADLNKHLFTGLAMARLMNGPDNLLVNLSAVKRLLVERKNLQSGIAPIEAAHLRKALLRIFDMVD